MKHFFSAIALLFAFAPSLCAQWSWGFEVGGTGSIFQTDNEYKELFDNKLRLGAAIGFVASFPLGDDDRLRIQPGISFVQKGGILKLDADELLGSGITDFQIKQRLNYLQVPLQVQYRLTDNDRGFALTGGPYFGLGLNGKADFVLQPTDIKKEIEATEPGIFKSSDIEFGKDGVDNYSQIDWGVLLGVKYFASNTEKLRTWNLGFQVALGLKGLETTEQKESFGSDNNTLKNYWYYDGVLKNLTFQLTATYLIDKDPH